MAASLSHSARHLAILIGISCTCLVSSFNPSGTHGLVTRLQRPMRSCLSKPAPVCMVRDDKPKSNPEDVTKKWGLEMGLFSALKQKEGAQDAKQLLAKYGSAYLITSITLSLISFTLCYVLIDNGVDVASLLARFGIEATGTTETAGTAALAYAAHKAASPIRFPPTVAITPIVAKVLFNKKD